MEMMGNGSARIKVAWPSAFAVVAILLLALCCGRSHADLDPAYYDLTCPELQTIVTGVVAEAIFQELRMGASLLRLHFHDCFVQGCDGSILLDDNSTFTGEKTARPNNGSVRGFNVIDDIKSAVEDLCPGVVSCADIVTLVARDSVVILGGPNWIVALGRRDSTTASLSLANTNLPGPGSSLSQLISKFQNQGLSTTDMIALSGAHTIGQAQCKNFRSHIYNDSNINGWYATSLKANCPFSGGDTNLSPLDYRSPTLFNNDYYKNLVAIKGLLHSDQQLYNHGYADSTVKSYSFDQRLFFKDFVSAMISMGNINPLTGTEGEIRTNCRKVN